MRIGIIGASSIAQVLLVSSCGNSTAGDESTEDGSGEATPSSSEEPSTTARQDETASADATPSDVVALAAGDGFAGANDQAGMEQAVAAFNATGLDFAPDVLTSSIPDSCTAIDADLVGRIFGVGLMVDPDDYPLPGGDGYLSCTLLSTDRPEVAMMYVHFAPDHTGDADGFGEGWASIGTMEGAFELSNLGDGAIWSDGSRGENLTNMSMLQLVVNQGGTQSYLQLQANDPQLELVGAWSAPKMLLALSAINGSLN